MEMQITKYFELQEDKSKNYMGLRSSRFAMIVLIIMLKNFY